MEHLICSIIMKFREKLLAIKLRKGGKSYDEIHQVIKVSKSTLSIWLRDIPLNARQKNTLIGRQKSRYAGAKANQKKRIERTKQIVDLAKKEVVTFINDPLFLAGVMLYWAEGTKRSNETVKLTNSDPEMIKLMMRWFRSICKVPEKKFRIALNIHTLHHYSEIRKYWSDLTKIPLEQFYKVQIKTTSFPSKRNFLYNGTCTITICNRDLFRKIEGWRMGLLKEMRVKSDNAPIAQSDRARDF